MLDFTPIYTDAQCVRDYTDIQALKDKTDEQIDKFIGKAQIIIDKEIGCCYDPVDPEQSTVFPAIDCGIPKDIAFATILLVEQLCLSWEVTTAPSAWDGCDPCWNQKLKSITVWKVKKEWFETGCDESSSTASISLNWGDYIEKYCCSGIILDKKIDLPCNTQCLCHADCLCNTSV